MTADSFHNTDRRARAATNLTDAGSLTKRVTRPHDDLLSLTRSFAHLLRRRPLLVVAASLLDRLLDRGTDTLRHV